MHFSTTEKRGLSLGSRFQSLTPWKHLHRLLQSSLQSWAANVTGRVSDMAKREPSHSLSALSAHEVGLAIMVTDYQ